MIGIIVVAVGIEEEVITRFRDQLAKSGEPMHYVRVIRDKNYFRGSLLNKSMALNDGIRSLSCECDIIACADIDMLIPPPLLSHVMTNLEKGSNIWARCRNIDEPQIDPRQWKEWMSLPVRVSGKGSFNAMFVDDWFESGGWDERLIGWGGEDDVAMARREQAGIKAMIVDSVNNFPLMHVNHPMRQNKAALRGVNPDAVGLGLSGEAYNWLKRE